MALSFTHDDLDRAHAGWACSCGPASLAAICHLTLDEVREHFLEFQGWTNPTMMTRALFSLGRLTSSKRQADAPLAWPRYGLARIQWEGPWLAPGVPPRVAYRYTHWVGVSPPRSGAVSVDPEVSFGRPVLTGTRVKVAIVADLAAAGESVEAIAREFSVDAATVRVAIAWHRGEGGRAIWDINACQAPCDGWLDEETWRTSLVPFLTADIKRATGGWHITHAIEVQP